MQRRKRVCVFSNEVWLGPIFEETPQAMVGLAEYLGSLGADVTLVWVADRNVSEKEQEDLNSYFRALGITLVFIYSHKELIPNYNSTETRSASVYFHLRDNQYDVIYCELEGGLAYYTLLAVEQGLFSVPPNMAVVVNSPLARQAQLDKRFLSDLGEVCRSHFERYCAENAGNLVALSDLVVDWMIESGWSAPIRTVVIPALLSSQCGASLEPLPGRAISKEFILFEAGRYRDGLPNFCDAMDLAGDEIDESAIVTMFGPFGRLLGENSAGYLLRRARNWRCRIRLIPSADVSSKLLYAQVKRATAVISTLGGPTGFWLQACRRLGVPVVGMPMQSKGDTESSAATRATVALSQGLLASFHMAKAPKPIAGTTEKRWGEHYEKLLRRTRRPKTDVPYDEMVSIVLVHYDRPDYLVQAIDSILQQTYQNIEVILVDDGSVKEEAISLLRRLEDDFKARSWTVIRRQNSYLGAARNAGVALARGDLILCMDDDNALYEDAIEKYVRAIYFSQADICTAFHKSFYGARIPSSRKNGYVPYLAAGGSINLGLAHDSFGDANAIVRRRVYEAIGGWNEKRGYSASDWEFFARASIAGFKLRIIPEPLYWYRSSAAGMHHNSNWYDNRLPILQAFASAKLADLQDVIGMLLQQNVSITEKESLKTNLAYNAFDQSHRELSNLEPNSDGALKMLSALAAREGRAETGVALAAFVKDESPVDLISVIALEKPYVEMAATQDIVAPWNSVSLGAAELNRALLMPANTPEDESRDFFVDADSIVVETRHGQPSIVVLPAVCPIGATGVVASAVLDDSASGSAEVMLLVCPQHDDPRLEFERASKNPGAVWQLLSSASNGASLTVKLPNPTLERRSVIVAVRAQSQIDVVVRVSSFRIFLSRDGLGAQRPKSSRPPQRKRGARLWNNAERLSARIVRQFPTDLPPLLFPKVHRDGVFLRPDGRGVVIAAIAAGFPAFAKKVIGRVEIAHREASSFEFAIALSRTDIGIDWGNWDPKNALAFSGWKLVGRPFTLTEVSAELGEICKDPLTINLAIRVPIGSTASPANAYWRQLVFIWES